ncbi:hypothetical protein DPEC_G00266450 [Dallia pectoralis]|uniref:Uncharacterized protein n=1 Tax=Dallia pectoralis TaxID=75939 RepID=A0ACC2FNE5_DALPE|nr:hypothetical protein DPEC_G00266450 [Dallia pectoralis]
MEWSPEHLEQKNRDRQRQLCSLLKSAGPCALCSIPGPPNAIHPMANFPIAGRPKAGYSGDKYYQIASLADPHGRTTSSAVSYTPSP